VSLPTTCCSRSFSGEWTRKRRGLFERPKGMGIHCLCCSPLSPARTSSQKFEVNANPAAAAAAYLSDRLRENTDAGGQLLRLLALR
jgi:hypothetical protein